MIIINKPEELIKCKCYKCGTVMFVHPMVDSKASWLTDCEFHKKENSTDEISIEECKHESDGNLYHVNGLYVVSIDETDPPFTKSELYKCLKCGELYR